MQKLNSTHSMEGLSEAHRKTTISTGNQDSFYPKFFVEYLPVCSTVLGFSLLRRIGIITLGL